MTRSRMNCEVHARFWESAGVRFPRATQLANVFADGVDVGKELLDKGLAVPYDGGTKKALGDEISGLLPPAFSSPLACRLIPWESIM